MERHSLLSALTSRMSPTLQSGQRAEPAPSPGAVTAPDLAAPSGPTAGLRPLRPLLYHLHSQLSRLPVRR